MQAALTLVPVAVILAVHAYSLIFTRPLGHPVLNLVKVEGGGHKKNQACPILSDQESVPLPSDQVPGPSLLSQPRAPSLSLLP